MPTIEPIQGFGYAGTVYEHEKDAVEAALRDLGSSLMKTYHACMGIGLIEQRTMLLELLTAYERLEVASKTAGGR